MDSGLVPVQGTAQRWEESRGDGRKNGRESCTVAHCITSISSWKGALPSSWSLEAGQWLETQCYWYLVFRSQGVLLIL